MRCARVCAGARHCGAMSAGAATTNAADDDVHNDVSDTDYPASFSSDYDTENDHYNHNSSTLPYR